MQKERIVCKKYSYEHIQQISIQKISINDELYINIILVSNPASWKNLSFNKAFRNHGRDATKTFQSTYPVQILRVTAQKTSVLFLAKHDFSAPLAFQILFKFFSMPASTIQTSAFLRYFHSCH